MTPSLLDRLDKVLEFVDNKDDIATFALGRRFENARLKPVMTAMMEVVKAAEAVLRDSRGASRFYTKGGKAVTDITVEHSVVNDGLGALANLEAAVAEAEK